MIETKELNISVAKRGGTASANAVGYRLTLPNAWMNTMGITQSDRKVNVSFDGEAITIKKECDENC